MTFLVDALYLMGAFILGVSVGYVWGWEDTFKPFARKRGADGRFTGRA